MKMTKKVLSILLSLMLVLGTVAVGGMSVSAEVPDVTIWGDANCDNQVDMADVVLIMQSLANPNRYGRDGTDDSCITLQGEVNADVDNDSNGITTQDAVRIQDFLLGKISSLNPNRGTGASSSATASDKNADINADVSFSFTDENGSNKVNLASGENRTIEVDVNIDAGNNPISALDVQFIVTNEIKISEIYDSAQAFRGKTVSSNHENLRANYTTLHGDSPMTAESGKSAFMIDVEVPAGTPDGVYYVDFSSCKIFKDNTSFNYTVSADPLKIVVGNETMEISTYSDLRDFADRVNSGETGLNAMLMNDIDASASDPEKNPNYNADTDAWTPIGNTDIDYTGIFDGCGYRITGLTFDDSSAKCVGLFGSVYGVKEGDEIVGGIVKNVGIEDGKITGSQFVGGVAGYNIGLITGCYFKGKVSGDTQIGGITGYNETGTVENCYNTGEVSGSNIYTGGVLGDNFNGTVRNCFNTGEVSGNQYIGGVVGDNFNGTVRNCYNTGEISGSNCCGGIIGLNYNSAVSNSYTTGNINPGTGASDIGIIVGYCEGSNGGTAKVKNCYYDSDKITDIPEIGGKRGSVETSVAGLTTAQMTGENALRNMVFEYGDGEVSPWLTKADGAEDGGEYYWYYPQLKGFNKKADGTPETDPSKILPSDWPAKVEITVGLSDGNSCTYDGEEHGVYVTVGDSSAPEGATGTYFKYTYSAENNKWEWKEISGSPTNPGKYKMEICSGDIVIETKYFTILQPATDYTVSYYKKTGEDWSTDTVTPDDAGNYKAVLTFTDTGHDQIEKEFTITPKSILSESVRVTLSQDTAEYTGGIITPDVTVKDGEKVLSKNADYIVSYGDNINAFENAKVIVTGKGNYKDRVEKTLVITPASVTLTANSRNTDIYDGTEKTVTGFTSSVSGLTFEGVTASGSGTQAGSYDVTFSGVTIGETKDSSGNYVVTATENGTLTINQAAPGTGAAAEDIDYGQTAVVTFTVPADAKGKVTFTLDEAESGVTKDIENGQAVCEFENLTIGSHKVECVYTGDGNYEPGEAKTASFEVKSVDCPLKVNYVYADGTEAAEAYNGNVKIFKEYSVTSPEIANYTPDTATVEGTMGDDDMGGKTVTVTYTPVEFTATFVDEKGETVAEVPYTVESGSIEAPAVPGKEGYNGEWEKYELTPGGITVKPVYTPADICPLDNEYHGTSFWGRLVKFFHTVIWKAFNLVGINIYLKIW